jgi:hypothetical protein
MPSRNDACPCGSGVKYKRCCHERLGTVASELRARDEVLGDLTAWLRDEHEETLHQANSETTLIRLLRGPIGRNMSLIWALNDYVPMDGGPPVMARYAERPGLGLPARAIAYGLAQARLDVYRVGSTVAGLGIEIEQLAGGPAVLVACKDGLEPVQNGEILVVRVVHATTMPTVWGFAARFPVESERRWNARYATLPTDRAEAALAVLSFHPDDAAEPIRDEIELHTLSWSIDDDEPVLELLSQDDLWENLGEAMPSSWAYAWLAEASAGVIDLGGWREHVGEVEVARLIVGERDLTLVSADRALLREIATHLEASHRGLIVASPDALAA